MTENGTDLKYFFWRRLHSLLGIFPIGVFLLEHFFSNSYVFQGPEAFNKAVAGLQGLPLIILIEVCFIAFPILFHILLGLTILYASKQNVLQYGTYRNWMYFLQRVTGMLAVVFIGVHVYETRLKGLIENRLVTFDYMHQYFGPVWIKIFYIVGIVSVVFHFANGISTSLITWGITVSKRSQQASAAVSWLVFICMTFWGLKILYAFS